MSVNARIVPGCRETRAKKADMSATVRQRQADRCRRRQRKPLITARLLHVKGILEREGDIVHVMAGRLSDLSHLIQTLPVNSRDFH